MLNAIRNAALGCLFSFAGLTGASADDANNPFARDILILTDWFAGEFDNEEQLWFHRRSRSSGEAPIRIHTIHAPIEAPQFGDHVFYVEEYKDNDPEQVYRQRLVIFSSDLEENAIRVRQGFFKKPEKWRGAYAAPEKFRKLKEKDVFFIDACDVFMRRKADQFEGGMKPKECVFGEGDKERYSVHDLMISESKFWRTDATYLTSDDSFHTGTPPGAPSEMRRAKIFYCDFFFYGGEGLGSERTQQAVENLRIHSQGGGATAIRKSDGASFSILLREKEYPYYETRPDFIYYSLRKTGADRSIAYGVADANSRQFGVNQGEIGAFCHREGYNFRESLEEL